MTYLSEGNINIETEKLSRQTLKQIITVLCIEEPAEKCHRKISVKECLRYHPTLKIEYIKQILNII